MYRLKVEKMKSVYGVFWLRI